VASSRSAGRYNEKERDAALTPTQYIAHVVPPNKDAAMRIIVLSLAATLVLAAVSVQAAPVPNTRHAKSHESPAQNVRKSQQYDHLVSTNPGFRAARMKKECGPIRDPGLQSSCVASFGEYEPR
jgi:hypothetical protein